MKLFPRMKMMIYIHDIKIWIKPITEDYEEEGSLVRTLVFKSNGQVILPLPSKFLKTFQTKLGDMVSLRPLEDIEMDGKPIMSLRPHDLSRHVSDESLTRYAGFDNKTHVYRI